MASSVVESRSCEFVESDIVEIIPVDEYDTFNAKLKSSIPWLVSKVYGSNIPSQLKEPFYENSQGELVLRPVMINLMSSSELYCQACANLFPETHTQWQGHWSIIQVLSRKGIYIADVHDTAVTETVLVQTAPFRLKAHLSLIDALMTAYIQEVASVEKVVKAVRKFATFNASSELPGSPEEGLTFWLNKVAVTLAAPPGSQLIEGNTSQKVRVVSQKVREAVQVPLVEDLMRDVGDGCNVAAVIAYYRPHQLNIHDVCLKEGIGIADSLYNLRLVSQFCKEHLPWKNIFLAFEDLLYTQTPMRVNILTFIADLFYVFEGPGSVEQGTEMLEAIAKIEAMPAAGKRSGAPPVVSVPISNATKKSFQKTPLQESPVNYNLGRSPTSPSNYQPLLSRRATSARRGPADDFGVSPPSSSLGDVPRRGRRVHSLSSPQDREAIQKSLLAWHDDTGSSPRREMTVNNKSGHSLLANVSIDSGNDLSGNTDVSLNLSELDSPTKSVINDPTHPDYMELESVTSGRPSHYPSPQVSGRLSGQSSRMTDRQEPLMPAVLKPTKEKVVPVTKWQERDDRTPRKKSVTSPTNQHHHRGCTQRGSSGSTPVNDDVDFNDIRQSLSSEATDVSSLPPGEPQSPRYLHHQEPAITNTSISPLPVHSNDFSQPQTARSDVNSVAESYTINNKPHNAKSARAAGIPVVSDSSDLAGGDHSREGSICSSGEYSDHESQKIHQDHKVRESGNLSDSGSKSNSSFAPSPVRSRSALDKPMIMLDNNNGERIKGGLTTNFAELKRLKDSLAGTLGKVDNSGFIYMQSGSTSGVCKDVPPRNSNSPGKPSSLQLRQGNKVTGGTNSPSALDNATNNAISTDSQEGGSQELQQLRLKLEQKRKEIERKKHRQEAQQNKMRQRMGKAAFMRVVSKQTEPGEAENGHPSQSDAGTVSTQSQIQARLGHLGQQMSLGPGTRQASDSQTKTKDDVSPRASAQRFTDWRTQSSLPRTGTNSSESNSLSGQRLGTLEQHNATINLTRRGSDSGSDGSNKAFSREGIQQTIDNVKNKWFRTDDLLGVGARDDDEADGDISGYRLHDDTRLNDDLQVSDGNDTKSVRNTHPRDTLHRDPSRRTTSPRDTPPRTTPLREMPPRTTPLRETTPRTTPLRDLPPRTTPSRDMSRNSIPREQTQYSGALQNPNESAAIPIPGRSSIERDEETLQEYDSSLDKLNNSLTELQGEIMKLSLQNEQRKAGLTPDEPSLDPRLSEALDAIDINNHPTTNTNVVYPSKESSLLSQTKVIQGIPDQTPYRQRQADVLSNISLNDNPHLTQTVNIDHLSTSSHETSSQGGKDGFFVAFDDSTPKRSKPPLSDHRTNSTSSGTHLTENDHDLSELDPALADQLAGNMLSPLKAGQIAADGGSPNVGFIIQDKTVSQEKITENDMQKKKTKLMEMQKRRREEQERRKHDKEMETARKIEEKQRQEEESERKKQEDKRRKEAIFQQYMQKKHEDEDVVKPKVVRRTNSKCRQRPKSMFVKSKPGTSDQSASCHEGLDSGSSSQEDLASRAAKASPSVMSKMRSAYHFRAPEMRKAVSCNMLPQNGSSGPSTYRRPASPDVYRVKHRQRGNSHDSSSDGAGSASAGGPDYSGPRLFVKPSAKSNRHIIVNALSHCCLAGAVNADTKNKVLEELSKSEGNHFLVLFRDSGCQYRGLFSFYPDTEEAFKIHGVGPKMISNKMCEKFYKYNSGGKSFSEINTTKHLSVSVDAVVLYGTLWKSGKVPVKR